MRKLFPLIKLNLRALLSGFKFGKGGKSKVTGLSAILLLGFLSVYMAGVYSFLFAEQLSAVGLIEYLIPMMAMLGCILSVTMTVQAAVGFIFSSKDSDIMLSLPVSAFSVMLSRITALYIEHLIFVGLFMVTSAVAAVICGAGGLLYFVMVLLCTLLLTFICTLLSTVVAFVVAYLTAKLPKNAFLGTIIYFAFFALVMVGAFRLNNVSALLLQNKDAFDRAINSWLLPFGLTMRAAGGDIPALLILAAVSILPFLLVVYLFSSSYKKILSALSAHRATGDFKVSALRGLKTKSQFSALFSKEVRRYFGSTIYFFNTGFGGIMLLIATGYLVYLKLSGKADLYVGVLGMELLVPLIVMGFGFMIATINTTCVSFNLEGRYLWILKEAPIDTMTIFMTKLGVNLLVGAPAVLCLPILGVVFGVDPVTVLGGTLALALLLLLVALFGLMVNLSFPKLDAVNEAMAVKQSGAALIGVFGGWIPLIVGAVGWALLHGAISFGVYLLIFSVVELVGTAGIYRWLKTTGAQRFAEL